jgi:phosphoribosyl 1,2-cyclic phosphodiesterase
LKVKFWGTRGSLPQATSNTDFISSVSALLKIAAAQGVNTIKDFETALEKGDLGHPVSYGGNTTCNEVIYKDHSYFIDAGSGLREAGSFYMPKGVKEFHIFLTHMHWDHVMGLPFFIPIHVPGCKLHIYHIHKNAPEHVRINFNGINFPLTFEQLGGSVEFHQLKLYNKLSLADGLTVTPFTLDHPGGSFGYRFDGGGKSLVIGVDGEYKRISAVELGKDLPFYQNLDLLVFDAQYEISELASRFDWGHCSPTIGVDLVLREGIKNLALTHHDPWANAPKLKRMLDVAQKHAKTHLPAYEEVWKKNGQPNGPNVFSAYDGLTVDLSKK